MTPYILAILGVVIGFFVGQFYKKKADQNWQTKCKEANQELKETIKIQKKDKKKFHQAEQQKVALQEKLKAMEGKYLPTNKRLALDLDKANKDLESEKSALVTLNTTHKRLITDHERLKKELQQVKDNYSKDLRDSKGWKNTRDRLEGQVAKLEKKLLHFQTENKQIRAKFEEQKTKIEETNKFIQDFKNMRATNRKLTKDLKYWEEKHYETHHQLANSLKEIDVLKAQNKEIDLLYKGTEIQQQNMLKKIEEFKTKFVNINTKYHELKASKN